MTFWEEPVTRFRTLPNWGVVLEKRGYCAFCEGTGCGIFLLGCFPKRGAFGYWEETALSLGQFFCGFCTFCVANTLTIRPESPGFSQNPWPGLEIAGFSEAKDILFSGAETLAYGCLLKLVWIEIDGSGLDGCKPCTRDILLFF